MTELLADYSRHMHYRGLTHDSITTRLRTLQRCQHAIGDTPLEHASTEELLRWLDGKRVAPRTRYAYVSHLATFYRWAQVEGHATIDPTVRIPRPKLRPGMPRPLSRDDILFAIGNAPDNQLRAMLVLMAYCGLRCMEVAGLESPDVFLSHEPPVIVVLGKGGKQRVIPISKTVIEALRALPLPAHGPVFRRDGDQWKPAQVSRVIRTHLHNCGIVASAHQLRHSYATAVLRESGGDLRMTQELLGHADPGTTAIYAQWAQDKAAEVVRHLYQQAA